MKTRIIFWGATAALTLTASSALAQASENSEVVRQLREAMAALPDESKAKPEDSAMLNRISFSFRLGFNVTAKFSGLGGFNPNLLPPRTVGSVVPPGTYPPGDPHANDTFNYDNGYVLVDSFDNNHGPGYENTSWYYGYDSGSASGSTVNMTKSYGQSDGSLTSNGDVVSPGLEIVYDRQLGRLGKGRWGVEGAINFAALNFQESGTSYGNVLVQNYAYKSAAPFSLDSLYGNYDGPYAYDPPRPYPIISAQEPLPSSQVIAYGQTIEGQYSLNTAIFGFRFGPFIEYPLSERFSVAVSGGLTIGLAYNQFNYTETTSVSALPSQTTSAGGTGSDVVVGGYVSGTISYKATESVNLFTGVQWQSINDYSQSIGGKTVEVDFGSPVFFIAGIGFSF